MTALNEKQRIETKSNTPITHHGIKVGDIFYSSWGYDQTNVDFYQVMQLVGKCTLLLKELNQERVEIHGYLSGQTMPIKDSFMYIGEVLKKRVKINCFTGKPTIKICDSSYAHAWDGKAKCYSGYA